MTSPHCPNYRQKDSDDIIWSTMTRLLNTPNKKVETYLGEGSEMLHSLKEYIGAVCKYPETKLICNCDSEDEKSSHEAIIESPNSTINSILIVRNEKEISQNSDENEILPELKRFKSSDNSKILPELNLTNHSKEEKDKFPLATPIRE